MGALGHFFLDFLLICIGLIPPILEKNEGGLCILFMTYVTAFVCIDRPPCVLRRVCSPPRFVFATESKHLDLKKNQLIKEVNRRQW